MKIIGVNIKNFRSIREVQANMQSNILVLVGQNNSGKSSFINALKAFYGQIELTPNDFHKDATEIIISIKFSNNDQFLLEKKLLNNKKIGIKKIPTTQAEFNEIKIGTSLEELSYNQYKDFRDTCIETNIEEDIDKCKEIWIKTIKRKLAVIDNEFEVTYKVINREKTGVYYNAQDIEVKDFVEMLPELAFIDDDRNFCEEEDAKAKTLTGSLFGNHILRDKTNICFDCDLVNCNDCINDLREVLIDDLNINDLERLINHKVKSLSSEISNEITAFFQNNFKDEYRIILNSCSNIDKSFYLNTKIYVPGINKYVELSKVGAGVRSIYILSLLQAFHKLEQNNNHLFIIEEPEIYLHPSLQKSMAQVLQDISLTNQVFITTHSPIILNKFEIGDIRKVYINENNESQVMNTQLNDILLELGYSTSDILYSEYVIFVEGKDDKEWLEKLINKFYNVDLNKFYIVDTKSCKNIETYATLRFLNKTNLLDNFLIFRDSDTMDREVIKRRLINAITENVEHQIITNIDEKIHVTEYSSFDNYFLQPIKLVELGVVRDEEQYYERIERFINSQRASIERYLRDKNENERTERVISLLYDNRIVQEKIEDIKKFVRGHDLFGQFGNLRIKTSDYIENSVREDFIEILSHLEKFQYLRNNRR